MNRHNWFKQVGSLLCVATVAAACATSGASPSPTPGASATSSEGASAPPPSAATPVTVKVFTFRAQDEEMWKEAFANINAKGGTNLVLEYSSVPGTDYDAALSTRMQSGDGPDIYYSRSEGFFTSAACEAGIPLELNATLIPGLDKFNARALEQNSCSGKIVAVPMLSLQFVWFYNLDIFQKVGVAPPTTWAELIAVLEKLKAAGYGGIGISGRTGATIDPLPQAVIAATFLPDAWIESMLKGDTTFRDPTWYDLIKRYMSLSPYFQDGYKTASWDDVITGLGTGKIATFAGGTWQPGEVFAKYPEMKGKFGAFLAPPEDPSVQKARVTWFVDAAVGVSKSSKVPDAALRVAQYAASPEFGTLQMTQTGFGSAVPNAPMPPGDPLLATLIGYYNTVPIPVQWIWNGPLVTGTPNWWALTDPLWEGVTQGTTTPEEFGDKATQGLAAWYPPFKGN